MQSAKSQFCLLSFCLISCYSSVALSDDFKKGKRYSKINSYSQTNAYLAYNFKQGRIMLYADNIFNSRDKINIMSSSDKYITYQQPRLIGVSAQINY